jgi:hypothetical protein
MDCEKLVGAEKTPCNKTATAGFLDSAGVQRWFCPEHLWESSPAINEHPCDMMTMKGRCDRPSSVKHTNPVGETHWWCEAHRLEFFPTQAEAEAKTAKEKRDEEKRKRDDVFWRVVWRVIIVVVCVVGIPYLWYAVGDITEKPLAQLTLGNIIAAAGLVYVGFLLLQALYRAFFGH